MKKTLPVLTPAQKLEAERQRGLGLMVNRDKRKEDVRKLKDALARAEKDVADYDAELKAIEAWAKGQTG
jgi:ribosomal 50S subunit-associated protein YjgA (DUF615 family)